MSLRTRWIGVEGDAFARVSLAFETMGYRRPAPDIPGGSGAYASNIAAQYQTSLSGREAWAIIAWGLEWGIDYIREIGPQTTVGELVAWGYGAS